MSISSVRRSAPFIGAAILLSACGGQASMPQAVSVAAAAPTMVSLHASAYQKAVMKTKPVAYFPLNSATGGSVGGKYSLTLVNGAKIAKGGAIPPEGKRNKYLKLADQAYATTSVSGDVPGTGSMVAWVNLAELPSSGGLTFYVCGESEFGNDLDLQFQNDNNLYFFTGSGENTEYVTNPSSLVGQWHMIAVTYRGGSSGFRNIYWDGSIVAPFSGSVDGNSKTAQFSIGESLVFTGRYFQGGIDAVALWKRALKASEISAMYTAAQ
jgi:Concanavalin A-like lectin/glucanases superfamily